MANTSLARTVSVRSVIMAAIRYLGNIIIFPRRTAREILANSRIYPALVIVLATGSINSILFLISHFARDYPPPPDVLQTWVEAWGEFGILPFVKIPAENYRLVEAIFAIPLALAAWILMAGSARLLSIVLGGKGTYDQYLSLFGISFFTFWILAQVVEMLFEKIFGNFMLPALRMEYGPAVRAIFVNFLPVEWTVVLTIGGLYNAIVTHEIEHFSWWKAGLVGLVTLFWPIIFISFLLR